MAEQIPGAQFVELPGGPHFPMLGDWRSVVDEIERFLVDVRERGEWDVPEPEPPGGDPTHARSGMNTGLAGLGAPRGAPWRSANSLVEPKVAHRRLRCFGHHDYRLSLRFPRATKHCPHITLRRSLENGGPGRFRSPSSP